MKRQASPSQETVNKVLKCDNVQSSKKAGFRDEEIPKPPRQKSLYTASKSLSQSFPFFGQPNELGCFCLDEFRQYHNDASVLKYYSCPPSTKTRELHLDLGQGYESFMKQDETNKISNPIDDLLRWIRDHPEKVIAPPSASGSSDDDRRILTDFICWRGLLTKLLCTPFEEREGWIVSVVKFHDTYYMCEYETQERTDERKKMTVRQMVMSYWGYKFEQYMVSSKPHGEPEDMHTPVDSNPGYNVVVKTRLESHSLLFAGEVDCCDPSDLKTKIELKTSRLITHPRQESSFLRFKIKKWWAQSFLLGVPKIICGFRDDDGIVKELKTYKTLDIPNMVKDKPNMWNGGICFNFLDAFLSFVKEAFENDDNSRSPRVFRYEPKVLRDKVVWEHHPPGSMYSFLPDWFVQDYDKLFKPTH